MARPGADEGLGPAVEGGPIARAHEDGVGDGHAVARVVGPACQAVIQPRQVEHGAGPAALAIPHGKGDEQVGRAVVGLRLVGVEGHGGAAGVGDPLGIGEALEVRGSAGEDVAHPVTETAVIQAILAPHRIPEGQILGVEGALGHEGLAALQGEVNAVTRRQQVEAERLGASHDDLVALARGTAGVGVEEGGGVSRAAADLGDHLLAQEYVVGRRALEFDHSQLGAGPVDAVLALDEAQAFPGTGLALVFVRGRVVPAAVVAAQAVAVLDDALIPRPVALPGGVRSKDDLAPHGLVELQAGGAGEALDEVIVDEELAAPADVDGITRGRWCIHVGISRVASAASGLFG